MQIKQTEGMWMLQIGRRLRIPEVKRFAAEYALLIEGQIADANLPVAGPWLFIAQWLPKDGKTPFDWRIFRPVLRPESYDGAVELATSSPSWSRLGPISGPSEPSSRKAIRRWCRTSRCCVTNSRGKAARSITTGGDRGAPYQRIEIQFGLAR